MKTRMLLIVIFMALAAPSAVADTGFLVSQWVEGNSRFCKYNVLGSPYVMTIASHNICPVTIEV